MRKLIIISSLALASVSLVACKSKVDDVKPATVEAPADAQEQKIEENKEEETAEKEADNREVAVNNPESSIKFIGAKITGDHIGGFSKWTGSAVITGDNKLQELDIKIDMSTVYSDDDDVDIDAYKQNDPSAPAIEQGRLDKHLMNEDFFNVEQFKEATFVTSKISEGASEGGTHTVTGDLTLHGVTKQITFPAKINVEGDRMKASADFSINRFDFKIVYEGKKDNLIKKEVRLIINLDFLIKG